MIFSEKASNTTDADMTDEEDISDFNVCIFKNFKLNLFILNVMR